MTWTKERADLAVKLLGDGLSAAQIAAKLGGGLSRCAVIGKLHRMGYAGGASRPAGRPAASGKKKALPGPGARKPYIRPAPKPPEQVIDPLAAVLMPPTTALGAFDAVMSLTPTDCKWPVGNPAAPDFRFCRAPAVAGLPYCADHGILGINTDSPVRCAHRDLALYRRAKDGASTPQGKTERTAT